MVLLRGKVHFAAASHVKPAPAADDVDDLGVRPAAVDNGELLATKPRPKRAGPVDLEDAVVFPFFCREEKHADLDGEIDYRAHPQDDGILRASLQRALANSGGLRDRRRLYVNGREIGVPADEGKAAADYGDRNWLRSYRFPDLGPRAQAFFAKTVEDHLAGLGSEIPNVYITEIITKEHPAYVASMADAATDEKLRGLLDMEAIEFVMADSVPKGSNIVGTRIVLAIKELGTPEERWKSRLVIQGCMYRESGKIVADSGCVSALAVRLLLIVGLALGFGFWSRDVKLAFLQSRKLSRDVYARLPKGLREKLRGYLLKIISPVYGLKEAGCYWSFMYLTMFYDHLFMKSAVLDRYLLFRHPAKKLTPRQHEEVDAELAITPPSMARQAEMAATNVPGAMPEGLAAILVDDSLFAGPTSFRKEEEEMHRNLTMGIGKDLNEGPLKFGGLEVEKQGDGLICHQRAYIEAKVASLRLPEDAVINKRAVKRVAGTLGWVAVMTSPHISYLVSQLNQLTEFGTEAVKLVNRSVSRALKYAPSGIYFPRLDLGSAYIAGYSDASLSNNRDLSSQNAGVVALRDRYGNFAKVAYYSRKCQRVTSSILAGETIAAVTLFDLTFMVRHTVSEMLQRQVDLYMFIYSYSLFQVIAKSSPVKEKRLLVDAAVLRQANSGKSLTNLGFCRTRFNISDCLSKDNVDEVMLLEALKTATLNHPVAEYIIADDNLTEVVDNPAGQKEIDLSLLLAG